MCRCSCPSVRFRVLTEVVVRSDSDSTDDRRAEELSKIQCLLSDGELTAPAPFDVATSAALAANLDAGDIAEKLFDITSSRQPTYRVHIEEVSGEHTREVVNTTADGQRTLFALLDGLMDELEARRQP